MAQLQAQKEIEKVKNKTLLQAKERKMQNKRTKIKTQNRIELQRSKMEMNMNQVV